MAKVECEVLPVILKSKVSENVMEFNFIIVESKEDKMLDFSLSDTCG